MDQAVRNKLRGVVTQCRKLLEDSISQELQGKFGIYAVKKDDVQIDDDTKMSHLSAEEVVARKDILDHFAHIKARSFKAKEALDQLVREIAFTHLNRFCAYKMMEARQVYVGEHRFREAVSRGVNSNGVKFYLAEHPEDERLFNTGKQDIAYRHFLNWLGGLLSEEIGVLFSPDDSANRLYPSQKVLNEVLDLINDAELADIWVQDETIGWVYQYFTPKELRDEARKASQAPRNSYELAFRNQFFTPRYVVEFLTDNTLGRIWYEMRKGDTKLKDQCRFIVRRPSEVFLVEGQQSPKGVAETQEDLSQVELLKLPVHIPHQPKKDPREIKVLDPASGSGHFLLYGFDLLVTIYEEAYSDPDLGPVLRKDFSTLADLQRAMPGLILAHNLHGIDIDLRASQIAALALWLRCQRAYQDLGLKKDRPKITRSNFVCAEPMPGEDQMLKDFVSQLEPKLLGQLVEVVFEKMKFAGEAGSLLKIEEEIRTAVTSARMQWGKGPKHDQMLLFGAKPQQPVQTTFDFSGITEVQFFEQAEAKVIDALRNYAEKAYNGQRLQRRLFSEDAVRGFAFVDLCHKRFDVILMNPPFGEYPTGAETFLKQQYPDARADILCAFVSSAAIRVISGGLVGAITNRTPLFTIGTEEWRKSYLLGEDTSSLDLLADLGHGVLDTALVEASAYCVRSNSTIPRFVAFSVTATMQKETQLRNDIASSNGLVVPRSLILTVPSARIAYWLPPDALRSFGRLPSLAEVVDSVDKGMSTTDDERFVRAVWEVPSSLISVGKRWMLYAKGGEYSPFVADVHLVVDWANDGAEIKATVVRKYPYLNGNSDWVLHPKTHHGHAGLTYTKRTTSSFSARILSPGCRISDLANLVYDGEQRHLLSVLALTSTSPFHFLLEATLPSIDSSSGGTAARHYEVGTLREAPMPKGDKSRFADTGVVLWQQSAVRYACDEASPFYFPWPIGQEQSLRAFAERRMCSCEDAVITSIKRHHDLDMAAIREYGFSVSTVDAMRDYLGPHPAELPLAKMSAICQMDEAFSASTDALADKLIHAYGGKRRFSKQSWIGDHRIELLAYVLNEHPATIIKWRRENKIISEDYVADTAAEIVSLCVGGLFGRWDFRQKHQISPFLQLHNPFGVDLSHSVAKLSVEGEAEIRRGVVPYDVNVQWEGILVDELGHQDDIVGRAVKVLEVLWQDGAEAIELEIGQSLSSPGLRDYFQKPGEGGFWSDHVARYSKSRRKAPIYWLLQSSRKNYSLWLYYLRLDKDILYKSLVNYVEPKIRLEIGRLDALRSMKTAAGESGKEAKRIASEVEGQEEFISELRDFEDKLRRVANLHLDPDLNDGVVLNIAPLHELVPWKEAKNYWDELLEGKYEWSSIGKQLRAKGIVK